MNLTSSDLDLGNWRAFLGSEITLLSLANLGRTPLEHIVLSGRWKSANVFTDFYLKSLAYFSENSHGLAPLVAFNANVHLPGYL